MLQKSKQAIDDLKQKINNKDNQMQKLRTKAKEGLTFSQNKISELEKTIEVQSKYYIFTEVKYLLEIYFHNNMLTYVDKLD